MVIREAKKEDLQKVMLFFDMMCKELGKQDFLPEGNKGGFPPEDMVVSAIDGKELYVGETDGKIMAAYIMNHTADEAYENVRWQKDLPKEQVVVLHALRVSPEYSGKGYATRLAEHAIETAKQKGNKAIRLDCIEGNYVPHKMYGSLGFKYIDTVEILYEDIGVPRKFLLFEKNI